MTDWSPRHYLAFADERSRPARDLLAQVPLQDPRTVFDLGCGPGNSTALLVDRYPAADITGIDNSPAMLAEARKACPAARFVEADLSAWRPEGPADLLFSNATFQWVPDHLSVIARLAESLAPGGVLAVQMPDNLAEPSHRRMQETAQDGPWASKLAEASKARDPLPSPAEYYRRLKPLFSRLDIWMTAYHHPLQGARGIVEMVKSTGLRPYLNPLTPEEQALYLKAYEAKITSAYPASEDGTVLLRFPRLFMVGVR